MGAPPRLSPQHRFFIGSFLIPSLLVATLVFVGHEQHRSQQYLQWTAYENASSSTTLPSSSSSMMKRNRDSRGSDSTRSNRDSDSGSNPPPTPPAAATTVAAAAAAASPIPKRRIRLRHPSDDNVTAQTAPPQLRHIQQQQRQLAQVLPTNATKIQYYYLHIPKVGGKSMKNMLQYHGANVKYLGPTSMHSSPHDTLHDQFHKQWAPVYSDYRVIMSSGDGYRYRTSHGLHRRDMEREALYPRHAFVMFREPTSHVISQYVACRDWQHFHGGLKIPYTLMGWLEGWKELIRQKPTFKFANSTRRFRCRDAAYKCFVPYNLQSWFVGLRGTQMKHVRKALQARFDVVGTLSDLKLSSCLFLTEILQGVPWFCNCDATRANNQTLREQIWQRVAWHSVEQHHAGVFKGRVTPETFELIRNFTKIDQRLYDEATILVRERAATVEEEYGVTLCRSQQEQQQHQQKGNKRLDVT